MTCYTSWNGRESVLASLLEQQYGEVTRDRVMSYIYSDQFKEKHGNFRKETDLPLDQIGQEPTFDWVQRNLFSEQINYQLKAVSILQSDKAIQIFKKAKENNWNSLDKILQELQVPKEQRKLILDTGLEDREEILMELASKYSYAVEVKTATDETVLSDMRFEGPLPNTSHYSFLTVPGGTNGSYQENNINVPGIVPSIKGHAQFQEDSSIGWFRSDTQDIEISFEKLVSEGLIKQVPC